MAKSSAALLLDSRAQFQTALHAWYRREQRPLPWRAAPSLYKTVVSEFMLQQTQVATVLPYFDRWLRALPDFAALAAAPEEQVVKLWEGLGYYSRARRLLQLARLIVARPAPPRRPADWRELPGIGPYTAAAVTSIAFGEPAACVDGNVVRILARLTGESRRFRDGAAAAKFFTPLADALIVGAAPGDHNQAMMELGATVCLRATPRCPACPVAAFCVARARGTPGKYPRLQPKIMVRRARARAWCEWRGQLLLRRGHAQARSLAGLCELPELSDLGIEPRPDARLAVRRRTITRFRIEESIYRVRADRRLLARIARNDALEWVAHDQLDRVTLSGPHRRWIADLLQRPGKPAT